MYKIIMENAIQIFNYFTTRELAIGIWAIIAMFWFVFNSKETRNSFFALLKCIFSFSLIKFFMFFFTYFGIITFALYKLNVWDINLLKDSIIWLLFTGIILLIKTQGYNKELPELKELIKDNFKFTLIFEFVYNTFTFPLVVEFWMVPIFFIIGGMQAICNTDKKYQQLKNYIQTLFAYLGAGIIFYCLYCSIVHFKQLATRLTLLDFLLPVWYFVPLLPLIYLLKIFSEYSFTFDRLNIKNIKNTKMKIYYKWKLLSIFKFDYRQLRNYFLYALGQDCNFKSIEDIDDFIKLYIEKNTLIPFISGCNGFNPIEALGYLREDNFSIDIYKYNGYDEGFGEYYANMIKKVDMDTIRYSIEGTKQAAQKLQLEFDEFTFDSKKTNHYKKYVNCVKLLFNKSFNQLLPLDVYKTIKQRKAIIFYFDKFEILVEKEKYPNNPNLTSYRFIIQINKSIKEKLYLGKNN